jgi:hypothetical protein
MQPTVINLPSLDAAEAARAKFWRKNIAKLTRKELSKATGYSLSTIALFEQGYDHNGKPLGSRAWKRYRLICSGLMASKGAWQW